MAFPTLWFCSRTLPLLELREAELLEELPIGLATLSPEVLDWVAELPLWVAELLEEEALLLDWVAELLLWLAELWLAELLDWLAVLLDWVAELLLWVEELLLDWVAELLEEEALLLLLF